MYEKKKKTIKIKTNRTRRECTYNFFFCCSYTTYRFISHITPPQWKSPLAFFKLWFVRSFCTHLINFFLLLHVSSCMDYHIYVFRIALFRDAWYWPIIKFFIFLQLYICISYNSRTYIVKLEIIFRQLLFSTVF